MQTSHPMNAGEAEHAIAQATRAKGLHSQQFDAHEEAQFREHKAREIIRVRRFAAVLAPLFWMLFLYWDLKRQASYDQFEILLAIRFSGGALLVVVAVLAFSKAFLRETVAETTIVLGVAGVWIAMLTMTLLAPAPANYLDYWPGLTMVLFFLFAILWIDARRATILGIALLLSFCASIWWISQSLPDGEVRPGLSYAQDFSYSAQMAIFYIAGYVLLGSLVAHQLEGHLRREFVHQRALRSEKRKTEMLNRELQNRLEHIGKMNARQQRQAEALLRMKEEQRRLAVEANRKKSTFLASATHDLRQPLTALQAIIEALDHSLSEGDIAAARQHMALTRRSSRAMRSTLNAVLEISRLESGVVEPDYSVFDVGKLVQDVYNQYAAQAEGKGLDFRLHLPKYGGALLVRSDRVLLTRLVANLVSNAIKYTAARPDCGSGVILGLVRFGNRIRLDVFDTGIGIDPAHRAAIFEPFVQLANRERDREKGLGLGLSIVRQIVDLLAQHRLDFRSVPQRGSRFSVDLPVALSNTFEDEVSELPDDDVHAEEFHGGYVLLVDDDVLVRNSLRAMLESWGCLVEACADLEAVADFIARAERIPDVVLTDFRLPDDKTAYDVVRFVEAEFHRSLPVIVMTGETSMLTELRKSVAEVVVKPPDHIALRRAIAASLRARGG